MAQTSTFGDSSPPPLRGQIPFLGFSSEPRPSLASNNPTSTPHSQRVHPGGARGEPLRGRTDRRSNGFRSWDVFRKARDRPQTRPTSCLPSVNSRAAGRANLPKRSVQLFGLGGGGTPGRCPPATHTQPQDIRCHSWHFGLGPCASPTPASFRQTDFPGTTSAPGVRRFRHNISSMSPSEPGPMFVFLNGAGTRTNSNLISTTQEHLASVRPAPKVQSLRSAAGGTIMAAELNTIQMWNAARGIAVTRPPASRHPNAHPQCDWWPAEVLPKLAALEHPSTPGARKRKRVT